MKRSTRPAHTARRALALLLVLLSLLALGACKKAEAPKPETEPAPPAEPAEEPIPEPEPEPVYEGKYSRLTGLPVEDDVYELRPVSLMINNIKVALPHYGISEADVWFEILAEGGINRIMAVFGDYRNIERIGSVRSARDYYVDYAQSMDAVFGHFGGSPAAYTAVMTRPVDHLDGMSDTVYNSMFFTDWDLAETRGVEHCRFATGEGITAALEAMGYRTTFEEDAGPLFTFNDPFGDPVAPAGQAATEVTLPFSTYITSSFAYDAAAGKYLRSEYGKPHIDEGNGQQVAADNIIIVFAPHSSTGDDKGRIEVQTTGSGDGYYISRGSCVPIRWEKASIEDFLVFSDAAGQTLSINPGKTWIAVMNPDTKADITFTPQTAQ